MKLVDVNILCYVVNRQDNLHRVVLEWWTAALRGREPIGLAWLVITGFLRISTNPRIFQQPLTLDEAVGRIDAWLAHPMVGMIAEGEDHWVTMKQLLREGNVAGKMATDAHLAALALSRRATLVSCDRDFARFRHLRWENPAD